MSTILTSRSGTDGKLHLEIPVPRVGVDYEVEVVVRQKPTMTAEEWRDWLAASAGAWQGEFERPLPCAPEERDHF